MEALKLLREWNMKGKMPEEEGEYYVFGKQRMHRDTPTAWQAKTAGKDLFTLRALVVFLSHQNQSVGQYIRIASGLGIQNVSAVERRELIAYLKGESDSSDQIQLGALPPTLDTAAGSSSARYDDRGAAKERASVGGSAATGMSEEQLREAKQRHAERLESASGSRARAGLSAELPTEAKGMGELMEGMSSDKLLELRAKRLSHKRQTIAEAAVEGVEGTGSGAGGTGVMDPAFVRADQALVQQILAQEDRVYDRNSTLRRQGKEFKFVLETYNEMRRKEKEKERAQEDGSYGGKKRSRSGGGDRGDRSGHGGHRSSSGGGSRGEAMSKDAKKSKKAAAKGPPIIIVPNMHTAMLNMFNAKEFLQDCQYVAGSAAKEAKGDRKPANLEISRTMGNGRDMTFHVIDNPRLLGRSDWDRVVCVVVLGAPWQFKGWQWDQPVTLFQHVLGVHVKNDDAGLDPRVAQWNVRVLEISKERRHLDRSATTEFWRQLDEFMLVHKSYLC